MTDKKVSPRIHPDTHAWLAATCGTANAGAEFVLGAMPGLYRRALSEIRGRFTSGELSMILDVLNGHGTLLASGQHGLAGQHLALSIDDSFALYPGEYEAKWGAECDPIMDRIGNLTSFQTMALEIWAAQFWQGDFAEAGAVEKHCKILLLSQ